MSDQSPNLALPYIMPGQAQKHVTHNEALRILDGLVQLSVLDRDLAAPPANPVDGGRYIVGSGATGDWTGWDLNVALWIDGAWLRLSPRLGWRAWVEDEGLLLVYDGAAWSDSAPDDLNVQTLGVNASADTTNRLAVTAPASLFTHDGAGHQLKINKAAPADTASLLFQTGFSGRAEMGTAGGDNFAIKVSSDGSTWNTALSVAAATGAVSMPQGLSVTGLLNGTAVTQTATDTTAGRLLKVGDFGLGLTGNALLLADLDATTTPSGLWRTTGTGTTGTFPAGANPFGYLIVHRYDTGSLWQLYTPVGNAGPSANILFSRVYNPATESWLPWQRLYAQNSVLGMVSQSAGVPTGALLERATNANGNYTRWADGTQECWRILTASAGAAVTWTFPAAFSAAPVVRGTAVATVLSAVCLDAAPGTTSCTLSARDASNARRADVMHLHAIGRWF